MSEEKKAPTYTVSSLAAELKDLVEGRYRRIYVEAEISGFKRYPSGHAYFTLKDEGAAISAVMFSSSFERCKARSRLKDGAKVLVYANCSVYPSRGNCQLVVLAAKIAGEGELMQRYLELKERLTKEGLFDASRKRKLPFLPRRIGLVTSEAGAVMHDMCEVMTRRFPALEILVHPCLVQGVETAPPTIIAGIRYFNAHPVDLIIVARGGGSFEDLFCFNDEALVREVAASQVPVISAVGHETDFTLCDFAADLRAGTPSIAAEVAVPVMDELLMRLDNSLQRLVHALVRRGEFFAQRTDQMSEALGAALTLAYERFERRLERAGDKLLLLSPYGVLERGYSLTIAADGSVIKDAASLASGDEVTTRFARGAAKFEFKGGVEV